MKKTFVTLLVSAVAVWGYVIFRIIMVLLGGTESNAQTRVQSGLSGAALFARARPPLDTAFRDPFQSYLYAQKPAPVAATATVAKAAAVVVEPPKAVLSGILWGDEPVAILKQDGQTELVKKGAEIWDLKVLRIEKTQVVVLKQGRQFTLGY
jgi:hypothetical protein